MVKNQNRIRRSGALREPYDNLFKYNPKLFYSCETLEMNQNDNVGFV